MWAARSSLWRARAPERRTPSRIASHGSWAKGCRRSASSRSRSRRPRRRSSGSGSRACSRSRTRSSTWRRSARSASGSSRTRRSRRASIRSSRPVTPADRLALLLERIDDLSLRAHEIRGNPAPLLASFVARIDRLKQEMISAEELGAHAERMLSAASGRRGPRSRGARGRVRAAVRRPRPPAGRARRARLRRPRPARLRPPPRAPARARARGRALRPRARGRVPGDELRRGDAAAAPDRGAPGGDRASGRTTASPPSFPTRRSCGSSATAAPAGASSTPPAPSGPASSRERAAGACASGARALSAPRPRLWRPRRSS